MKTKVKEEYKSCIIELEREIKKTMLKEDIFGLAVALVEGDQIIYAKGYGFTDREKKDKITPETVFSIQSMSKSFTSAAFFILASEELIDLDDPIRKYYPEFTINTQFGDKDEEIAKITFRRMLGHWASFTHEAPVGNNYEYSESSFEEHIKSIGETWLRAPVGSEYAYSNLGYDLTGYVLGLIKNKTYQEVMNEVLFSPLGMDSATFDLQEAQKDSFAYGGIKEFSIKNTPLQGILPSGGIYLSVLDVAKYVMFHLQKGKIDGKSLLKQEFLEKMYSFPYLEQEERGYAFGIYSTQSMYGKKIWEHGGGGYGYFTNMAWIPDENIGAIVLTNDMGHPSSQVALSHKALGLVLKAKNVPEEKEVPVDKLKRLQGIYDTSRYPYTKVDYTNGKLYLHSVNGQTRKLYTQSDTIFVDENKVKYTFVLDENHNAKEIHITENNYIPVVLKKVEQKEMASYHFEKKWEDYLGYYQYDCYGGLKGYFAVLRKNDSLYVYFPLPLKMKPIGDNLFSTNDGEVLDLNKKPITFRNIPARKVDLDIDGILKESSKNMEYHKASVMFLSDLAITLNFTEGFETAINFIEKLEEINKENQKLLLRLGKTLYAMDELDKARTCFQSLLTKDKKNEQAFVMLEKTIKRMN